MEIVFYSTIYSIIPPKAQKLAQRDTQNPAKDLQIQKKDKQQIISPRRSRFRIRPGLVLDRPSPAAESPPPEFAGDEDEDDDYSSAFRRRRANSPGLKQNTAFPSVKVFREEDM